MSAAAQPSRVETRLLFLRQHLGDGHCEALPGDAGQRLYFRVRTAERSLILLDDAPPDNSLKRFLQLSEALRSLGLPVPQVEARHLDAGLALLSDFGDDWLRLALPARRGEMLPRALQLLQQWQRQTAPLAEALPPYDLSVLQRESALFAQWFLPWLRRPLSATDEALLSAALDALHRHILAAPRVVIHRDFHSCNLMQRPQGLGILDYQDALWGHQSYDLISLTRDAYWFLPWSERRYWEECFRREMVPEMSSAAWADLCDASALQRHLKILGIFVRLAQRDGKSAYLPHLPRVLADACAEAAAVAPELWPLLQSCQEALPAALAP